jgi:uncharacterized membrane protein YhfC
MKRCRPETSDYATHSLPLGTGLWILVGFFLIPAVVARAVAQRVDAVPWMSLGLGTWLAAVPGILLVPIFTASFFRGDDWHAGLAYGIALSISAGVSEETSRLAFYRWGGRARTSDPRIALAAGAAHGAIEAWALGAQTLAGLQVASSTPVGNGSVGSLIIFAALVRPFVVLGHIALSALVWRAAARGSLSWFGLAVLIHTLADLSAFVLPVPEPSLAFFWLLPVSVLALAGVALVLTSVPGRDGS